MIKMHMNNVAKVIKINKGSNMFKWTNRVKKENSDQNDPTEQRDK